jgi:DNA-binding CsgD family transcriptional regulator
VPRANLFASRFDCTKQAVQQLLAYRHSSRLPGARIIALIKRGYRNEEIAAILGVTPQAVRYHPTKA